MLLCDIYAWGSEWLQLCLMGPRAAGEMRGQNTRTVHKQVSQQHKQTPNWKQLQSAFMKGWASGAISIGCKGDCHLLPPPPRPGGLHKDLWDGKNEVRKWGDKRPCPVRALSPCWLWESAYSCKVTHFYLCYSQAERKLEHSGGRNTNQIWPEEREASDSCMGIGRILHATLAGPFPAGESQCVNDEIYRAWRVESQTHRIWVCVSVLNRMFFVSLDPPLPVCSWVASHSPLTE